jgi:hypothetical protein
MTQCLLALLILDLIGAVDAGVVVAMRRLRHPGPK